MMLLYILFIVLRKRSNLNDTMKKVIDRNAIFSSMILLLTFFLFTGLLSSCSHDDDEQEQIHTPLQKCNVMGIINKKNIDITESDTTNTDRLSTVMAYRTADDKQSLTLKVRLITSKDSTVDLHLYVPDFMNAYEKSLNHDFRMTNDSCCVEINYFNGKAPVNYVSSTGFETIDFYISNLVFVSYYAIPAGSSEYVKKYRYEMRTRLDGILFNKNNKHDRLRIGLFVDLDTPITVI